MNEIKEFDAVQATANAALEVANAVEVQDIETAATAKAQALELQKIEKSIEEVRVALVKPLNDQVREINAKAKAITAPIEAGKKGISGKLLRWQNEERLKAEQAAAEEKARLEAEAAALAEKDDATLEEIEAVEAKAAIYSVPVKMLKAEKPLTVREIWKYTITDESKLPREFLMPNTSLIGERVRGGLRIIPGVEIYSEQSAVLK